MKQYSGLLVYVVGPSGAGKDSLLSFAKAHFASHKQGSQPMHFVRRHITRPKSFQNHTIRQLSKQVGLNECDLKKQFKHHTGLTIAAYAKKAKMETALVLLSSGMRPVKVANHLGYCNLHYFTKVFTTFHGYAPSNLTAKSK